MKKRAAVLAGFMLFGCSSVTAMASSKSPVHHETKAQFVESFLAHNHVKPDKRGHSPFYDVSTRSTAWGYVHKAIELHLLSPSSKHRFGGSITQSQAASVASHYYHMNLAHKSPLTWAKSQGLFKGSPSSTYLTAKDVSNFNARLDHLKNSLKAFPDSWTLTPAQASILGKAFQNSNAATTYQETEKLVDKDSFLLTKAGKTVLGSIPPEIDTTNVTLQTGLINGLKSYYMVETDGAGTDSTDAGSPETTRYFIEGPNLYVNSGDGWTADNSDYSAMVSELTGDNLEPNWLQFVTAKQTKTGYTFSATINKKILSQLVQSMAANLSDPQSPLSPTAMKTLIKNIVAHGAMSMTLNVGSYQNAYYLLSSHTLFTSTLPENEIPWPAGTDLKQMQKVFSKMVLNETGDYTDTYNTTPPMAPPSDFTPPAAAGAGTTSAK